MGAAIFLLVVLTLTLVVVRVGAISLSLSGLSVWAARFQSLSALSGVGFTTTESEPVAVNHPVRRHIVMLLMLFGNAGLVTAVSTLIVTFVDLQNTESMQRLGILLAGLIVLCFLASSRLIDRRLAQVIRWGLKRWSNLVVHDYAQLLQWTGDHTVVELLVGENDWLAGRTLPDARLAEEGGVVLGDYRSGGDYVGVTVEDTAKSEGDRVILYGGGLQLAKIDARCADDAGDVCHRHGIELQQQLRSEQPR